MALENTREDKIYASVLSDGKIHVTVPDGTEGAVVRTYEISDVKTGTKKTGTKTELVYNQLSGHISDISFYDGDFGKNLVVTVGEPGDKPVALTLGTASNFGEDLMKKIPAIDLEQSVILAPYSFEDDKGKKRKGITVTQNGSKVANYFYDPETKENLHDYPMPPKGKKGKPLSTDEWKMYFTQCRIFLVDYIEERFVTGEKYAVEANPMQADIDKF